MPKPTTEKKIGGEYGDVRASIDVEKLNAYLEAHVPEVTAPVTVKQFKVRTQSLSLSRLFNIDSRLLDPVWTSTLRQSAFLQIPDVQPFSRIRPTF